MAKPQHPLERIGKFFPIFIIILIIIISVIYLQSLKVMSDTTGQGLKSTTSKDLSEDVSKDADNLFKSLGYSVDSLLQQEKEQIDLEPLPKPEPIILEVNKSRLKQKKGLKRALEFVRPDAFINSDSFRLVDMVGKKVILLEFCTFSSLNCVRGYPFMNGLYDKYSDYGLDVITIHTPEFEFEKDPAFVKRMVSELGITYPVIMDSKYYTWRTYNNKYWPTRYLIDIDGFINSSYTGEGNYATIESNVRSLLKERASVLEEPIDLPKNLMLVYTPDFSQVKTPTIYLGSMKNRGDFGNDEGFMNNLPVIYSLPDTRIPNVVYVEGEWFNHDDYMELVSDEGRVVLTYTAKNVDIVASGGGVLNVSVDGSETKELFVNTEGIYNLVSDKIYAQHSLDIDVKNSGFRLYSISFS